MKVFYTTGTIIFAILILILAFENMAISVNGFLFIFFPLGNAFLAVASVAIVGAIFGIFLANLVNTLIKERNGDEEAPGGEW